MDQLGSLGFRDVVVFCRMFDFNQWFQFAINFSKQRIGIRTESMSIRNRCLYSAQEIWFAFKLDVMAKRNKIVHRQLDQPVSFCHLERTFDCVNLDGF